MHLLVTATALAAFAQAPADGGPNFRTQVLPVLTRLGCSSGACHGALAGKGGFKLSLRGYAPEEDHYALTRQASARRVDRHEPAASLLLRKATATLSHGGGAKLDPKSPEYALLADWIATGASGPRANDPTLVKLEATPAVSTRKPKDRVQVAVQATYSDGRVADVTRWAKFSTTEDAVAGVDEQGVVFVAGPGEAAINVWFSDVVVAVRIVSPFPNAVDPQTFAKAERHNFVDDLVLKKLEALRIPPSPLASDREFIRRAFLDTLGLLPTPAETEAFAADPRPDRRARLIASLVERPEYVDYWTYKWSDLLLISSRKLPQPAMRAFSRYVRQAVADDVPWDRFAREILTASGSNLAQGGANYFVLHKDVAELAEATTVTFLGTSIACARCHNHPLEKWTQDQYWSFANLFSRVGVRNGDRLGEFLVNSLPEGETLHLKRGTPQPPAPLDGPVAPASADRRRHFADWLTAPDNPLFARALVNRVWRNFMGRGLVEAEDDFRQTNPPTNPELLDALAGDFVKHGYDVKRLVRTILTSATYQRTSAPVAGNASDDRHGSHYLVRRLPAEVVLDAYSQVTKAPTAFGKVALGPTGGVANTTDYPLGTRALQLPDTLIVSQFLDAFGRPERGQTCSCERQAESSVTQALHLNNGQTLNDKLRAKDSRVAEWLAEKVSDDEAVRRIFAHALCRPPSDAERARFSKLLAESSADATATRREALEDLFWAVLTSREFLFNR